MTYSHIDTDYENKLNSFFQNQSLLTSIEQEQSKFLYQNIYKKYFQNIFPVPSNIFGKIGKILNQQTKLNEEERLQKNDLLLMHLFRNKTHNENIDRALKLNTKQITDQTSQASFQLFSELKKFINNE